MSKSVCGFLDIYVLKKMFINEEIILSVLELS